MKTFFKSILAVAVCASLFAACSKDDTVSDPSNGRKVTMTVTASSELESASGSRTTYDPLTGKISWNETSEYLQVFETAASKTTYANSQEGTVSDGTAKFAVSFPENTNTPLVYNAVYPASAWITSNNTDITNMKVVTRTSQQPTATSFDSNADLLIAKSISLESQPTELQMSFGRAVAIGKMTVKNLASEEPVLGVEFTAPDKKVTGRSYVDMTAGTVKEYGYPGNFSDNVTLSYSSEMNLTANGATGMTAYFTCFPFEVAAGETFTVTVTTASKIFTKTVTVQEGRPLAFAAGDSSTFAVDMTDAAEEATETLSGDYGRLMTRRGYVGTLYLNRSSLLLRDTLHRELSPKHLSLFLHERAVARLDRLALAPDEQALCNAMTAGDRRSLSPALRAAYSRSGTSHLLAVSGLHVGIVFLLANLLLWWLPLFRHGHILRNIAVILLIWLYAATTGFPPSVVRAALMFSVLQFALASSSEYVGMNTLAGVAFVMLLFHPDYLFDISFQLSFIAVAGIIAWGLPLCRLLRTRRKSIDMLTATLAIGFSASAATAPLISHTFGQISVVGLTLNPVVILLSYVVVGSCTLWLVIPGTALAPLFSVVAGFAARAQNELIRAAAALPAAALDIRLTTTQCWSVYGLFIFATLLLWSAERKKSVSSLPE